MCLVYQQQLSYAGAHWCPKMPNFPCNGKTLWGHSWSNPCVGCSCMIRAYNIFCASYEQPPEAPSLCAIDRSGCSPAQPSPPHPAAPVSNQNLIGSPSHGRGGVPGQRLPPPHLPHHHLGKISKISADPKAIIRRTLLHACSIFWKNVETQNIQLADSKWEGCLWKRPGQTWQQGGGLESQVTVGESQVISHRGEVVGFSRF